MESIVEKLQLKDIDKSTWKKYRFDQIAKNISERIEPSTTDLEIYVGLEHIDSEAIHIKRFGKREDVNGTKLRCYPGDIIFGRRRAYQRKAAIAEFDGFCSAHSLVLRANPDVINPKLFPFFMHSDTFMHRAVDISVGSLSPTINWGDLKKQEFMLPPFDQQEHLSELLWAAEDSLQKKKHFLMSLKLYRDTFIKRNYESEEQPPIKFSQLLEVNPRIEKHIPKQNLAVSFLPMQNVSDEGLITELEDRDISEVRKGFTFFKENDILFAKITPCMENGKGTIAEGLTNSVGFGSTEFHVLRPKRNEDLLFCYYLTMMPDFRFKAEQQMTGSAGQKRVPSDFFEFFKFRAPNEQRRFEIGNIMHEITGRIEITKEQINNTKSVKRSLINQLF